MKKTLVALAVLAASGASFAQATITGTYAFGYSSSAVSTFTPAVTAAAATPTSFAVPAAAGFWTAGPTNSGFGTDTADINISATENLGGGMSATARMGISGASRGAAVTGNTASLSIRSAAFGLTLGTIESGNGLLGNGSSGASGIGVDDKAISGASNIDLVSLTVPLSSALTMGASYADRGAAGAGTGLGVGTVGAADNQPSIGLSMAYSAGALAARGDYTSWTRLADAAVTSNLNKSRIRLSAGYDMGVARLSAGYSNTTRDSAANGTVTETLLGVKVPMGAVTLGMDYAMGTASGHADTSGYSIGVGYDLSKRTNISTSVANWKQRTGLFAANENSNAFRVLVAHSF